MYAVNLIAMMNLAQEGPAGLPLLALLRGIVTEDVVLPMGNGVLGHDALLVREDVSQERWEAIVKLIRTKLPRNEFPLYEKTDRGWRNIKGERR
jgi:hypothetical protein